MRVDFHAKHVAHEFVVIRQFISSNLCQKIELGNELNEVLPPLSECVQFGHGRLFLRRIFKELCYDRRKLQVGLVVEVMGQVIADPVDDFKGSALVHVGEQEPLHVVVTLEGSSIGLYVRVTLSLEHTPVLGVSIKSFWQCNVLFGSGSRSGDLDSSSMGRQLIQDLIRVMMS